MTLASVELSNLKSSLGTIDAAHEDDLRIEDDDFVALALRTAAGVSTTALISGPELHPTARSGSAARSNRPAVRSIFITI
ncbi:hypothetical protein [Tropicimonas aquimaris]|uniref:Uncharacterized protein n=1 Tax=Tropicimonas aquimaris TaxID=914152 RepID=A0ABW3IX28_9RHOB